MSKSEENDIFQLAATLSQSKAAYLKDLLGAEKTSKGALNLKVLLFSEIRKKKQFDASKFLKAYGLSQTEYNTTKHILFQDILDFIKSNYDKYSDIALENKIIEFEVLVTNGLFIKANRKLKLIKKIAYEKSNFSVCARIQQKAIAYNLFNYDKDINSITKAHEELETFCRLSEDLNNHIKLSHEVLNFHFSCQDKRSKCSEEILGYLKHDLLADSNQSQSLFAKYYYYRIKSLIYLGSNDFELSKSYSLKAFDYLSANASIYRNDLWHLIRCKNNYLEGSLSLMETEPFEKMYPEILELTQEAIKINKKDIYFKSFSFQFLCSLRLRYCWLIRDCNLFKEEFVEFKKSYDAYKHLIWPNYRVEILLGFAKMKFMCGDLTTANDYCNQIVDEKMSHSSVYKACGNLLRIMVNFDRNNHQLIPHLISTSSYALKKTDRLFDLEKAFLTGLKKIKPYYSQEQNAIILKDLKLELIALLNTSSDMIIDKNIRILEWLDKKF